MHSGTHRIARLWGISLPVIFFALVSCAHDPGIPLIPIPVIPYAPSTQLIPEKAGKPLTEAMLIDGKGNSRSTVLAMRGGRAIAVVGRKTVAELLQGLPAPDLKKDILHF